MAVVIVIAPEAESTPRHTGWNRFKSWFFAKILKPIFSAFNLPATPPPVAADVAAPPATTVVNPPVSPCQVPPTRPNRRNPVMEMIQQQELGKSMLNLGAPITIALLVTNPEKFHSVLRNFILTGLSAGCTSIWIGLVARQAFPKMANVVEQTGIILVLVSFNGFIASALPMEFAWVPMICGGLCISTFIVAAFLFR